jgi:hypothetical protein
MKAADLCLTTRPDGAGLDHIAPVEFFVTAEEVSIGRTESSYAAFGILRTPWAYPLSGIPLSGMSIAGRPLTTESLGALNCCIRGEKSPHRKWPWDRLPHVGHDSRYEWQAFVAHLGLEVE